MGQSLAALRAPQAPLDAIVAHFAALPQTAAVALAGSQTASVADANSDLDIYIYVRAEVPLAVRAALAAARNGRGGNWQ